MSWRYDPIFISQKYSVSYHIERFEQMAEDLQGYTRQCVVSFIDLYEKTKRNFPQARSVTAAQQEQLIETFPKIAAAKGIQIHLCCEDRALTRANVDADGCLSQTVLERAIGSALHVPKKKMARDACSCLLGADIGMYNTCGHGCLYCYANYDNESVRANRKLHDPASPLLIGHLHETDIVKEAEQKPCLLIRTNDKIAQANEAVRTLAKAHHAHYIDINAPLKDEQGNLKAEYTIEGMHIKEQGYRAIFDSFIKYALED